MNRRLAAVSIGWLGISMVQDAVPAILLPHQLLATGHGQATTLGLVTLGALALAAFVQPVAGRISDAHGRWPVIMAGVGLGVAGLVLLIAPTTMMVGALAAVVGVSIAQAGYQPLLPRLIPADRRGRASGLKSALDVAGATLGFFLLAALLAEGASLGAVAVLGGALAVPFALARALLPGDNRGRGDPARPAAGWRQLVRDLPPGLVRLVLARFCFLLGIYGVGRFLLLFVGDRMSLDADAAAAQAGLALGLLALVTVAASVPSGWLADRLGRRPLMLAGGALAAAGIGLLPTAGSIELVLVFGVLMAVGSAAFTASSWAALADLTATADAGRLLALANFGTAGAAAAAGAFGLVIDAGDALGTGIGFSIAFAACAVAALGGGALAWRAIQPAWPRPSPRLAEVSD